MTTCSVLFAGCREAARVRRVHRLEPELREGVVRGSIRRRSSVRRRVLRGGHGRAQAVAAHQARPVRAEHTHDYPPSHSNTESPPNHHRRDTESPPNHHRITTESPPNHHPITDHRNPTPPRQVRRERPIRKVHPPRRRRPRRFRHGQHHPVLQEVSLRGPVAPRRAHGRAHARTRALQVRPLFCTLVLLVSAEGSALFVYLFKSNSNLIFRSRHVGDSCVANSLPNTENARNLDTTPDVFDNTYWKHVTRAECPKRRKHADRYDKCTAPYLTGESPFYVL